MLGWTFRKFKGKLIVKPSKKSVKAFTAKLHDTVLGQGKSWEQGQLIRKLNQQLRGWANYHQSVCSKDTFSRIDHILYEMLWRWAKRRHPNKNRKWIVGNYWHSRELQNWIFSTDKEQLLNIAYFPIIRHTKVRMDANPYFDTQYFIDRKFQRGSPLMKEELRKLDEITAQVRYMSKHNIATLSDLHADREKIPDRNE